MYWQNVNLIINNQINLIEAVPPIQKRWAGFRDVHCRYIYQYAISLTKIDASYRVI